jgi:hypothetical protein
MNQTMVRPRRGMIHLTTEQYDAKLERNEHFSACATGTADRRRGARTSRENGFNVPPTLKPRNLTATSFFRPPRLPPILTGSKFNRSIQDIADESGNSIRDEPTVGGQPAQPGHLFANPTSGRLPLSSFLGDNRKHVIPSHRPTRRPMFIDRPRAHDLTSPNPW